MDYLAAAMEMLGGARNKNTNSLFWEGLHERFGVELPRDFRAIVDAFAPVQINHHLYLQHPESERWNLGDWMESTIEAWSQVEWSDVHPSEDPRILFGLEEIAFGGRTGLLPMTSTDRGETVFLARISNAACLLVEDGEGGWERHEMSFAEWLYRYLIGEEMAGPATFYAGPVRLQSLPVSPDGGLKSWYGPPRSM
ncbi:SMI1/KNR4 family protein [Streptomyces sp. NBC_01218]|uniref:SMI1/KNR4 family protein n=1 Tax=Streptomyces sp. NBC_01218 TaxID=2903780 RepID=UPI002E11A148|nr:SMI1/KNR4 family protein [Streptomyces sp. NBC_01218]